MGQAQPVTGRDTECDESACYPIVSRISPERGNAILEKLSQAAAQNSACLSTSGTQEVLGRLTAKLTSLSAMMGPLVSAGLRSDEAAYITKFESCFVSGVVPGATEVPGMKLASSGIPWTAIGIGAGALVLLAALS